MAYAQSTRKRTATPAQKEAAKLRRERFRGIVKSLAAMSDTQRQALAEQIGQLFTCEGHLFSYHNTCLIASQCPHATLLGGIRQWNNQGRRIKKDEHGYMIWVPVNPSREGDPDTPQPSEWDSTETPGRTYFVIGTVFDVSQTCETQAATEIAAD